MAERKSRMSDAGLYVQFNTMQAKDAEEAMKEFSPLFKWGKAERVLDVGSGPGDVTSTIIKSYVPQDASVTGSDISKEMVDYATAKYNCDQIKFRLLDIENVPWETEMESSFNKIFSFYCFHWIQNESLAVDNMFKLLKPSGELFLLFLAKGPIFDLYSNLKMNPTWAPYMHDADVYISKYHNSANPAEEFKELLIDRGFTDVKVTNQMKCYYFDSKEQMMKSIIAVNPFVDRIPSEMIPAYKDDIEKFVLRSTTQSGQRYRVDYCLMIAHAVK